MPNVGQTVCSFSLTLREVPKTGALHPHANREKTGVDWSKIEFITQNKFISIGPNFGLILWRKFNFGWMFGLIPWSTPGLTPWSKVEVESMGRRACNSTAQNHHLAEQGQHLAAQGLQF